MTDERARDVARNISILCCNDDIAIISAALVAQAVEVSALYEAERLGPNEDDKARARLRDLCGEGGS